MVKLLQEWESIARFPLLTEGGIILPFCISSKQNSTKLEEKSIFWHTVKTIMNSLLCTLPLLQQASLYMNYYRPPTNLREGEDTIFSCVYPSDCPHGGGSHVTITHDGLDLTVLGPQTLGHQTQDTLPSLAPFSWTSDMWSPPYQTWDSSTPTASDTWWPSLETCWNLFTWGPNPPPTSTDNWWPPKHIQLATGWHVYYRNTFLLDQFLERQIVK